MDGEMRKDFCAGHYDYKSWSDFDEFNQIKRTISSAHSVKNKNPSKKSITHEYNMFKTLVTFAAGAITLTEAIKL